MTGSEHTSTTLAGSAGSKPQEQGQQIQQKSCEELTDASSSPSPTSLKRKAILNSYETKSPSSGSKCSSLTSSSPSDSSSCAADFTNRVSGVHSRGTAASTSGSVVGGSGVGNPKMKRTISNCNIRTSHNASTLCSKGSSYVYHCPSNLARRNGQQRQHQQKQQQHRPAETSTHPFSLATTSTNFHLPLCEDPSSDETQSMVELGRNPFRVRATQHGSSIRRERGGSRTSHASIRTTQHAARPPQTAADPDHLQHSSHQV